MAHQRHPQARVCLVGKDKYFYKEKIKNEEKLPARLRMSLPQNKKGA